MNESELIQEISNWEYLASTLEYEHQKSLKHALLMKAENLKAILKDESMKGGNQ